MKTNNKVMKMEERRVNFEKRYGHIVVYAIGLTIVLLQLRSIFG